MRKYYKLTEAGTKETVNRLAELEDFIRTKFSESQTEFKF
jgi:DNA-binding PadR family transcriptional regulator